MFKVPIRLLFNWIPLNIVCGLKYIFNLGELVFFVLVCSATSAVFISNLPECSQRRLVELVWHLQDLSTEDLGVLSKYVLSSPATLGVKQYLIQIVHHR